MAGERSEEIRQLNDTFRKTFLGGKVVMTQGVKSLGKEKIAKIFEAVKCFEDFSEGNDPYQEHDFGRIEIFEKIIYWKIDYYDKNLEFGSENPADPEVTTRVLTVMLAEEY